MGEWSDENRWSFSDQAAPVAVDPAEEGVALATAAASEANAVPTAFNAVSPTVHHEAPLA
jgi:hypothetical protein